jgi:hypothetical protein
MSMAYMYAPDATIPSLMRANGAQPISRQLGEAITTPSGRLRVTTAQISLRLSVRNCVVAPPLAAKAVACMPTRLTTLGLWCKASCKIQNTTQRVCEE